MFEVVIAGGGVAALEGALALHELAGDRVKLTILCPVPDYVYRPVAVLEPFVEKPPRRLPLADFAKDVDATVIRGTLASVDPVRRVVVTGDKHELPYDALLVAVGAQTGGGLPGAININAAHMAATLERLIADVDGALLRSIALVAPASTWPLPVYELALLLRERARRTGVGLAISIITAEHEPLEVFGSNVSAHAATLLEQLGVETVLGSHAHAGPGTLIVSPGGRELSFDRVVTVPQLTGPNVPGLPVTGNGFLPVTPRGEVFGTDHVYAAGDATYFPVKFGGIAAQQADAAAASIAALAGVPADPALFDGLVHGSLIAGDDGSAALYFSARIEGGRARESRVSPTPTSAHDAKIAATYLTPYLDRLWAEGPRWVANQLSWERALASLEAKSAG